MGNKLNLQSVLTKSTPHFGWTEVKIKRDKKIKIKKEIRLEKKKVIDINNDVIKKIRKEKMSLSL